MSVMKIFKVPFPATLLALFALASVGAHAQSMPGASKTAEISAFGGFAYSSPDYGQNRNKGFTVGADYTRFFGWRLAPSLEIRANRTTGDFMTQETFEGGLKAQTDFHRFHPYGTVLVGVAKIIFDVPVSPVYKEDRTVGYSLGGGVDIDLVRSFQAKVDYQAEFWNFGSNGTQPNNGDFSLAPKVLTVGVVYRLPLHPHKRQRDNH